MMFCGRHRAISDDEKLTSVLAVDALEIADRPSSSPFADRAIPESPKWSFRFCSGDGFRFGFKSPREYRILKSNCKMICHTVLKLTMCGRNQPIWSNFDGLYLGCPMFDFVFPKRFIGYTWIWIFWTVGRFFRMTILEMVLFVRVIFIFMDSFNFGTPIE